MRRFDSAKLLYYNQMTYQRRVHTDDTDRQIEDLFILHGARWRKIANFLGGPQLGWTDDVVRNRLNRVRRMSGDPLEPTVKRCKPRKPGFKRLWTTEEDALLLQLAREGLHLRELAAHFKDRKRQSIRNRRYRLLSAYVDTALLEDTDLTAMLKCIEDECSNFS